MGIGWGKEIQEEQRQAVRGEGVGRDAGDGFVRDFNSRGASLLRINNDNKN